MSIAAISSLTVARIQQQAAANGQQMPASQGRSVGSFPAMRKRQTKAASLRRVGNTVTLYVLAVWSRFLGWQMRRATRLLLMSLDDRTLADIGVRRDEIDTVLREMEQRKAHWYANQ